MQHDAYLHILHFYANDFLVVYSKCRCAHDYVGQTVSTFVRVGYDSLRYVPGRDRGYLFT